MCEEMLKLSFHAILCVDGTKGMETVSWTARPINMKCLILIALALDDFGICTEVLGDITLRMLSYHEAKPGYPLCLITT